MAKTIAIANQKGGVGKTTTSVNLAASLGLQRRVLLIDLDPQGNAAMSCGVDKDQLVHSSCDLLNGAFEQDIIIHNPNLGFDLIGGNAGLTAVELQLVSAISRERRLVDALQSLQDLYDYILIDCPPSLNILTLNALVAADGILIPMQCEYYALEGLSSLVATIESIQERINPELQIEGILRTMVDTRSRLTQDVSKQLLEYFSSQVFTTCIPRNVRLAEAPSHGKSIIQYDNKSRGAIAYRALADEIINQEAR